MLKFPKKVIEKFIVGKDVLFNEIRYKLQKNWVGEVSSEQWSSEQCTAVLLYCSTASSG